MEPDIRQTLSDKLAREINAEIDADTIKRHRRGERLVPDGRGSYEWVYIVDEAGNPVHPKPGEYGTL